MPKELQMSVLIASSNEKFDQVILSLLPANEYGPVDVVNSAGAARRRLPFQCSCLENPRNGGAW